MQPPKRNLCYLCGAELTPQNRTKDHVPPKGIFARPLPPNLITVPCCRPCNEGSSHDEDFFRLVATLGVNRTPEAEMLYEQRTLPNTIKKNRLRERIAAMLTTSEDRWVEVNGVIAPLPHVRVPVAPLRVVITKITRGLIAHFHPEVETHSLHFDTYLPSGGKLIEAFAFLADDLTELRIGESAFHAYHGACVDTDSVGVWLMTFHQRIPALVVYYDDRHHDMMKRERRPL